MADCQAQERDSWIDKNAFYYEDDYRYMRFLVPEGLRVLELGCGTGQLLAALKPSEGVGIDISGEMVAWARKRHPQFAFIVGDVEDTAVISELGKPFDVIILSDTIGLLEDCETTLSNLHQLCTRDTRLVIAYYNRLWGPLGWLCERIGEKMPQIGHNWLSTDDIAGLLYLADFEMVRREWRQLMPKRLFGVGRLLNRHIGTLPLLRRACLRNYVVARPVRNNALGRLSATVVVPCRNELGNIEAVVRRMPRFCEDLEILFVEGHSTDGTLQEISRVIAEYPQCDIKVVQQDGVGKGDAVRKGFAKARGEVLMILDADLTVPPEDLPKFYKALIEGKGSFINGSRLIYAMEKSAMRPLNFLGNRFFALLFSYLLNERVTDTLCGTKVLTKSHYREIAAARQYFGDFDPFGDFDLIFGAAKANLKIVEVPIRYGARIYGETKISRFTHGWLLFHMVVFAYRKLKAF
ncbi:MAG: bifunctional class I SAM-dependent methyltransferase/glycosyltransferase family 2 protein [Nitrospira sp.]|nr:bifunctional class I SAM-dependent methyltransferase/glycosyltransferase family 2 protein [Nitrospira sp.]